MIRLVLVFFAMLHMLPGTAAAQRFKIVELDKPEQRITPYTIPENKMRNVVKAFARCIYRSHQEQANALLENSDYSTIDYSALGYTWSEMDDRFSTERCLRSATPSIYRRVHVRVPRRVLRRALAEEAYLAANDAPLKIGVGSPEFLERNSGRIVQTRKSKTWSMFGDCVVFHSPKESDRLLRRRQASSGERDAIKSLLPAMSACISSGEEVALDAGQLRAAVAEGLYERSRQRLAGLLLAEVTQ